jgi:putative oxidoreductase
MTRDRWTNAVSVVLAAIYGFTGVAKLLGMSFMRERFQSWDYPDVLLYGVGMLEVLGAIALMIPRIASVAAVGLAMLMLGAVYTHLFRGLPPLALVPIAMLGALAFVAKQRLAEPQSWIVSWDRS